MRTEEFWDLISIFAGFIQNEAKFWHILLMGGSFETSGRDQLPADNREVTMALRERENWKYLERKFIWGLRSKYVTLSWRSMLSFILYTFYKKSVKILKMSCRHVCSRVQSQFNFVSIFDSLGYNTISNSLKDNFMSFRCQIDSHNNFLISNFLRWKQVFSFGLVLVTLSTLVLFSAGLDLQSKNVLREDSEFSTFNFTFPKLTLIFIWFSCFPAFI